MDESQEKDKAAEDKAKQTAEVLEKVKKVAAMAECPLHEEDGTLFVNVGISEERSQVVYISHSGRTPDEKDVITFHSPCRKLGKGFMKGLGKKEALELLRINSKLIMASFALYDVGEGEDALMVISDQLVDTMDVEEFETRLLSVAHVADGYEADSGGGDQF